MMVVEVQMEVDRNIYQLDGDHFDQFGLAF